MVDDQPAGPAIPQDPLPLTKASFVSQVTGAPSLGILRPDSLHLGSKALFPFPPFILISHSLLRWPVQLGSHEDNEEPVSHLS